ncbi:hypothetical protein KKG45_03385, partial [bacterium]|nr:hypothetical protein [bacterium]
AMSRLQARRVLADVGRGAIACAAGTEDPADTAAVSEIRKFASGLASADLLPAHLGHLEDVSAVTEYIKRQVR